MKIVINICILIIISFSFISFLSPNETQIIINETCASTNQIKSNTLDNLWERHDADLQNKLNKKVRRLGLWSAVKTGKLTLAIVDITNLNNPRVASLNGDKMMYAASLPKIAIMFGVFQKIHEGKMILDSTTKRQLFRMIRNSNNRDSTILLNRIGKAYLNKVLESDPYRLYDRTRNGGLWVGKDYAKYGLWKRDPLHNLSHGATAIQVARFYYLLESKKLVSESASRKMKEILGKSFINHKFKYGLSRVRPNARIFRKSGSWKNYHSDSAIVERNDAKYIIVGLTQSYNGESWLIRLIQSIDSIF